MNSLTESLLLWRLLLSGVIVGNMVRGTNHGPRPWRVPRDWKACSFRDIGHDQLSAPFFSLAASTQPMSSSGRPSIHMITRKYDFGEAEPAVIFRVSFTLDKHAVKGMKYRKNRVVTLKSLCFSC